VHEQGLLVDGSDIARSGGSGVLETVDVQEPVAGPDQRRQVAALAAAVGLLVADHVAGKGLGRMMLGLVACNRS
jgi:hypothetical protein